MMTNPNKLLALAAEVTVEAPQHTDAVIQASYALEQAATKLREELKKLKKLCTVNAFPNLLPVSPFSEKTRKALAKL